MNRHTVRFSDEVELDVLDLGRPPGTEGWPVVPSPHAATEGRFVLDTPAVERALGASIGAPR